MRGLTIEQAADKAEIKLSYFRYLMAQLNGTSMDLRIPPVAGERARRYSPQKLAAWMAAGKPLPGSENAAPDAGADGPHVAATAHRAENGSGWVMTLQDPSHTVEATSLKRAWEISRVRAAESLGVKPESVSVDFHVIFRCSTQRGQLPYLRSIRVWRPRRGSYRSRRTRSVLKGCGS